MKSELLQMNLQEPETERSPMPHEMVPGMAYVPFQQYKKIDLYDPEDALQKGTLFHCLDKPFYGKKGDLDD